MNLNFQFLVERRKREHEVDIVDLKSVGFSLQAVAALCSRGGDSSSKEKEGSETENSCSGDWMSHTGNLRTWRPWLKLIEPSSDESEEIIVKQEESYDPPDCSTVDLGRGRRMKDRRNLNEKLIWKEVSFHCNVYTSQNHLIFLQLSAQVNKSLSEERKAENNRKRKRKSHPTRKNNFAKFEEPIIIDGESEKDDDGNDEEDDGEVSLKMDDICALCNAAWVEDSESSELQDVMIICDGCDGSYHTVCVG